MKFHFKYEKVDLLENSLVCLIASNNTKLNTKFEYDGEVYTSSKRQDSDLPILRDSQGNLLNIAAINQSKIKPIHDICPRSHYVKLVKPDEFTYLAVVDRKFVEEQFNFTDEFKDIEELYKQDKTFFDGRMAEFLLNLPKSTLTSNNPIGLAFRMHKNRKSGESAFWDIATGKPIGRRTLLRSIITTNDRNRNQIAFQTVRCVDYSSLAKRGKLKFEINETYKGKQLSYTKELEDCTFLGLLPRGILKDIEEKEAYYKKNNYNNSVYAYADGAFTILIGRPDEPSLPTIAFDKILNPDIAGHVIEKH